MDDLLVGSNFFLLGIDGRVVVGSAIRIKIVGGVGCFDNDLMVTMTALNFVDKMMVVLTACAMVSCLLVLTASRSVKMTFEL